MISCLEHHLMQLSLHCIVESREHTSCLMNWKWVAKFERDIRFSNKMKNLLSYIISMFFEANTNVLRIQIIHLTNSLMRLINAELHVISKDCVPQLYS